MFANLIRKMWVIELRLTMAIYLLALLPGLAYGQQTVVDSTAAASDSLALVATQIDSLYAMVGEVDSTYAARIARLDTLAADPGTGDIERKNLDAVEEELRLSWKADRDTIAVQLRALNAEVPKPPRDFTNALTTTSELDSLKAELAKLQEELRTIDVRRLKSQQRPLPGEGSETAHVLPKNHGAIATLNNAPPAIQEPAHPDVKLQVVNAWSMSLTVWLEDGTGELYAPDVTLKPPQGRITYGVERDRTWFVKTRRIDTGVEWVRLWVTIPYTQRGPVKMVITDQIRVYNCPDCRTGFNAPRTY